MKTRNCIICSKKVCDKCRIYVLSLHVSGFSKKLWVCCQECYVSFAEKLKGSYLPEAIGTSRKAITYFTLIRHWGEACMRVLGEVNPKLAREFAKKTTLYGEHILTKDGKYQSDMKDRFSHLATMTLASNLEEAGRLLDAAEIYDNLQMYGKARKLREKEKHIIVKRTDISVDLNRLIQQLRDGGIVVVYRCPNCSGKLKIDKDTSVESLKVCEYCGSEIETLELADFLRTALS